MSAGVNYDVNGTTRDVLITIAALSQSDSSFSVDDIAAHVDCNRATVFRHIKKLQTGQYIEVRRGGGKRLPRFIIQASGRQVIENLKAFVSCL